MIKLTESEKAINRKKASSKFYLNHKESLSKRCKEYYSKNRESILAQQKEYRDSKKLN